MQNTTPAQTAAWTYGKDSKEGGRATQEDRCAIVEFTTADGQTALLAMVADGIGGRTTGELASQWATETIPQRLKDKPPSASEIPQALIAAFQAAHERIYDEAAENPSRAGMGTTCTVVVVVGLRLYLAHVGDSRAYVIRRDRLHQLSIDHTWAEDALAAGRSREEIRTHPNRGVIKRYLGIAEDVDVDTRYQPFNGNAGTGPVDSASQPFVLEDGDRLMLCTDGVSDVQSEAQMLTALRGHPADKDEAATALVQAALKAHAQDNVTAVVVDLPGGAPITTGRRVPVWAIGGLVGLLLLAVGAFAGLVLARGRSEPTPLPAQLSPATPAVSVGTLVSPTATVVKTATPQVSVAVPTQLATVPSSTSSVATGGTTVTPIPTFTSMPTDTPQTTSVLRTTPVAKSSPQVTAGIAASSPTLLEPPDKETRNGTVEFRWQPGGPLPAGAAYEVVWWPDNADPATAKGFTDPTTNSSRDVNLAAHFDNQQTIRWSVLVVYPKSPQVSYQRLTQPTNDGSRRLTFQPPSSGGGGGVPGKP